MALGLAMRVMVVRIRAGIVVWRRLKSSVVAMAQNKTNSGVGITVQTNYRRVTPVFRRALEFEERVAVRDTHGEYTYGGLLTAAKKLADNLTARLNGRTQERVVIVFPNDASYVIALWACWISGQIAVPIRGSHSDTMLEYFVTDCDSNLILGSPQFESPLKETAAKVGCKLHVFTDQQRKEAMRPTDSVVNVKGNGESRTNLAKMKCEETSPGAKAETIGHDPNFYNESDALIVYTAGTTGTPKGAVLSYSNLEAQVKSMVESWAWRSRDCLLHVLPLDHMHGIVDALLSPLSVGARCVMMKEFDSSNVWSELTGVQKSAVDRVNILMAVPWMYTRLIDQYDISLTNSERMMDYIRATCLQKIRLMTCGCFPLPKRLFERWEEITGHQLLERYSIMETGVIFSNPLHGARFHGMVGMPLPRVYVRLVSESDGGVLAEGSSMGTRILSSNKRNSHPPGQWHNIPATTGLLQVRGDSVFRHYWRKPNATIREFTPDGWFKTGDVVQYKGMYKLLGKAATDMVKSGGFVVSALQVEMLLMDHEAVAEAIVVGIQDPTWGQKLGALVVKKEGRKLSEEDVKAWAKEKLPEYSVPEAVRIVEVIPRNMMGKVNKFHIAAKFFGQPDRTPDHRKARTRTKTK